MPRQRTITRWTQTHMSVFVTESNVHYILRDEFRKRSQLAAGSLGTLESMPASFCVFSNPSLRRVYLTETETPVKAKRIARNDRPTQKRRRARARNAYPDQSNHL